MQVLIGFAVVGFCFVLVCFIVGLTVIVDKATH